MGGQGEGGMQQMAMIKFAVSGENEIKPKPKFALSLAIMRGAGKRDGEGAQ